MKFAVIVFPGSNCDHDALPRGRARLRTGREFVWHKETELKGADVVILPGGFSYGDYLRTGAIARFSPIMAAVADFAETRRPGPRHLQRLPDAAEAGLLPGAMLRNRTSSSTASTSTCASSRPTHRSPRARRAARS